MQAKPRAIIFEINGLLITKMLNMLKKRTIQKKLEAKAELFKIYHRMNASMK